MVPGKSGMFLVFLANIQLPVALVRIQVGVDIGFP